MADTTTSDEISSGCSLVLSVYNSPAPRHCGRVLEQESPGTPVPSRVPSANSEENSPGSPSKLFEAAPRGIPGSPREALYSGDMQEQQQQHLRAMLGTSGQLAYYGLRLAPPPHVTNTISGGICSTYGSVRAPNAVPSVRPALYMPLQAYQHTSSAVSSSSVTGHITVSASTSTPSTHAGIASSTSCVLSSGVDSSTPKSPEASKCNQELEDGGPHSQEGPRSPADEGNQVQDAGNAHIQEGGANGRSQENGGGRKSPPPPSRMVTRSQTAAGRTPVSLEVEERVHSVRTRGQKRARSCSDDREAMSPRKMCREPIGSTSVGFDDLAFSKNPAGAGIEFGAVCSDCGAVAVTGAGWSAHQAAHRGEGAACSFCTQVFLSTHGRDAHQQLHRDGQMREVEDFCECGLCGGSFIAVMYLELHLLELHGREALYDPRSLHLGPTTSTEPSCPPEDAGGRQLFRCGICNSIFTFSLNLDCHMALHSDVSYGCSLCDATFPALDPLVTHSKAHRFAGVAPSPAPPMPLHVPSPQVPVRRPAPPQRHILTPAAPPAMNMWGAGPMRPPTHHPNAAVNPTQPMASPIGVPVNPAMNSAMTPAMLNYCMMMSLWGGEKPPVTSEAPVWPNYFNPSMANVFNYFNPYLLNNNNNSSNNNSNINNNNNTTTANLNLTNNVKGTMSGAMRKDGNEVVAGVIGREDTPVDGSA